jgi:hypothetical protein
MGDVLKHFSGSKLIYFGEDHTKDLIPVDISPDLLAELSDDDKQLIGIGTLSTGDETFRSELKSNWNLVSRTEMYRIKRQAEFNGEVITFHYRVSLFCYVRNK